MSGQNRLGDYVEVKDRIPLFLEKYPDGRLVTAKVKVTDKPDGVPRVWVKALAYRSPDDPKPAVGWSWMILPGSTNFTRGSELENTETSAWGRALAALNIGIGGGIATSDEIAAKAGESERKAEDPQRDGLTGTLSVKTDKRTQDFLLRQTPKGATIGFRLTQGRSGLIVECHGELAEQLAAAEGAVDATVTVWGRIEVRSFEQGGSQREYRVLIADRIRLPGGIDLPVERAAEAETVPMFDSEEQAAIDRALEVA